MQSLRGVLAFQMVDFICQWLFIVHAFYFMTSFTINSLIN